MGQSGWFSLKGENRETKQGNNWFLTPGYFRSLPLWRLLEGFLITPTEGGRFGTTVFPSWLVTWVSEWPLNGVLLQEALLWFSVWPVGVYNRNTAHSRTSGSPVILFSFSGWGRGLHRASCLLSKCSAPPHPPRFCNTIWPKYQLYFTTLEERFSSKIVFLYSQINQRMKENKDSKEQLLA